MSADEARHLLGGYATGTLTREEQLALFEAALQDQELFDALQREEALRETLLDGGTRAGLLQVLQAEPRRRRFSGWWAWTAAASAIAAVITVALLLRTPPKPSAATQQVADVRTDERLPQLSRQIAPPMEPVIPPPRRQAPAPRRPIREEKSKAERPLDEPAATSAPVTPPAAPAANSSVQGAMARAPVRKMAALRGAVASLAYTVEKQGADGSFEASSAGSVQPGDTVRILVQPPGSGVLTLENVTGPGAAMVLASLAVDAGSRITVPDPGITVQANQRLRLTFRPGFVGAVGGAMPAQAQTPVTAEIVLAQR